MNMEAQQFFNSFGNSSKTAALGVYERILKANESVNHPKVLNMEHYLDCVIMFLVVFGFIRMLHLVLVQPFFKKQYFALHVLINIWIVCLCGEKAIHAFLHPESSTLPAKGGSTTQFYMCVSLALHVYHPIYFQTGVMDWIHHTPVYILNFLMFSVVNGDNFCFQGIVLSGIPGGLDYFLLVLEGEGLLSRTKYKDNSALINNWIRAPLGSIAAYTCLLGLYHGYEQATLWQCIIYSFMGLHCYWNVPFFARQTIEANIVDTMQRHGMVRLPESGIVKKVNITTLRTLSGVDPKPVPKATTVTTDPNHPFNSATGPKSPLVNSASMFQS